MRFDVLSLILGWTLIAISIPLFICSLITIWLDDFEMAMKAFLIPIIMSPTLGSLMLKFGTRSDTPERLRDREAFAAVALIYPIVVFIVSFHTNNNTYRYNKIIFCSLEKSRNSRLRNF